MDYFDILFYQLLNVCVLIFMTSPLWLDVSPRSKLFIGNDKTSRRLQIKQYTASNEGWVQNQREHPKF